MEPRLPHRHTDDCCGEQVPVLRIGEKSALGTEPSSFGLDSLGAGFGLICAIHCLAMPVLVGVLPLLGLAFVVEERFEWTMAAILSVLAIASALWGYQKHRALRVVMSFAGSLGLVGLGLWLEESVSWGHLLMVAGAVLLVFSHLFSAKLCRRCAEDDCCA